MIQVRILGSFSLTASEARDVDAVARQSKRAALIAYLATAVPRGMHRRDRLLALFWPESDARRARAALSQTIYVLRSALREEAIVTRGDDEVGLDPEHVWCDTMAFEDALDAGDAATALSLYRGDLLEGFFITGAPEFEQWLDRERARLRERASEGAWALAERTTSSDPVGAARWARRAAELLPADEAVVRRLMRFLHALGDRAAAIRAYEAFGWRLAREYELEPSAETQSLAATIRGEVQRASWTLAPGSAFAAPTGLRSPSARRMWATVALGGVAVILAGTAVAMSWAARAHTDPVVRVPLEFSSGALSAGIGGATLALSPDGTNLAYLVKTQEGTQLYLRPLAQALSIPVPHTEGATLPFFSPDGKWLGFVADTRIRKVPVDGGPAITVTNLTSNVPGASWGPDGVIVFASGAGGSALWRVSAVGGQAQLVARPDSASGRLYRWPEVLPSGHAAVFTIVDSAGFHLAAVSLATGAVTELGVEGTSPHFVRPDQLVFSRVDGGLYAVPFSPGRLEIAGPVLPVTDGVMVGVAGAAKLSLSRAGMLAYVPEATADRSLVLVDRAGVATPLQVGPRAFARGRFSPDGTRIAVATSTTPLGMDVWLIDLRRNALTRFTADSGSVSPLWSRDGSRLAFSTKPGGRILGFEVRWRAVDGRDSVRTLLPGAEDQMPDEFSPDGRALVFELLDPARARDLWILPLIPHGAPTPYLQTRFNERGAALSPDGRWLAYVSNQSGADEIYVDAFPEPGAPVQVSHDGGREPRWGPLGRELFYRSSRGMVAVPVELAPRFRAGASQVLFDDRQYVTSDGLAAFDVHPDGQRFLMTRRGQGSDQVVLLLNRFGTRP